MKCATCNYDMPDDVMFCPNCGARVSVSDSPSSAGTPTYRISTPDENRRITTELDEQDAPVAPYGLPQTPLTPQVVPRSTMPPAPMPDVIPNSTAAVVSLIFGILSWTLLPVIGAIVAIVAGHMGRREIDASGGRIGGKGMTTAGLILGYAHIVVAVLACIAIFVFVVIIGASSSG